MGSNDTVDTSGIKTGNGHGTDFRYLNPYYQEEFTKISESNESYKGKWNWAAFFFSGIWALTKGLWLPFLVSLGLSFITSGIAGFIYPFIYAIRGNYMYYSAHVKGKQPWI